MAIANGYCTLAQVKAAARVPVSDTIDDSLFEIAVESASRTIDQHCGRPFYQSGTVTRYFVPRNAVECDIDDVAGSATIAISSAADATYDITLAAADYQSEPLNRMNAGIAFPTTRLRMVGDYSFPTTAIGEATVRVQASFGFATAVPVQVTQAAIVLATRYYKRFDSPLGVAGFGEMGAIRVSRVDPDVSSILAPFRKGSTIGVA